MAAMQDQGEEGRRRGSGPWFRRRVRRGRPLDATRRIAWSAQCPVGPDAGARRLWQVQCDLLVGNFGDGRINAFDPTKFRVHGEFQKRGFLHGTDGSPLVIDGLWALGFGNGAAGSPTTLFFTAGPDDESHGLFGEARRGAPAGQAEQVGVGDAASARGVSPTR